jgi:hypothetical protein
MIFRVSLRGFDFFVRGIHDYCTIDDACVRRLIPAR